MACPGESCQRGQWGPCQVVGNHSGGWQEGQGHSPEEGAFPLLQEGSFYGRRRLRGTLGGVQGAGDGSKAAQGSENHSLIKISRIIQVPEVRHGFGTLFSITVAPHLGLGMYSKKSYVWFMSPATLNLSVGRGKACNYSQKKGGAISSASYYAAPEF